MIAMLVTPNCGRWLAFTLGVILTSAPKLVSPPTCGFLLQDFLYEHDSE